MTIRHNWGRYNTCMVWTRAFPSPVSLSWTRIRNLRSLQGTVGPSPVRVSEASNSFSTVKVTYPFSIVRFRIWRGKGEDTNRCSITLKRERQCLQRSVPKGDKNKIVLRVCVFTQIWLGDFDGFTNKMFNKTISVWGTKDQFVWMILTWLILSSVNLFSWGVIGSGGTIRSRTHLGTLVYWPRVNTSTAAGRWKLGKVARTNVSLEWKKLVLHKSTRGSHCRAKLLLCIQFVIGP